MFDVASDLWRSSGPILLLKQAHLEPVAQMFRWLLIISRVGDSTTCARAQSPLK